MVGTYFLVHCVRALSYDRHALLVSMYVIVEDIFDEKERCRIVVSEVNGSWLQKEVFR